MSEQNKRLVLDAMEALITRRDLAAADTYFHRDFVNHEAADTRPPGPQGMKETARWLHETFGAPTFEEQDSVAEGDLVMVRVLFRGTHEGELMGMPATGRSFETQQFHGFRVRDGKISEHWACRDDLGLMRQLGLAPEGQLAD